MLTRVYWVEGPWPGKLALAARPRGGDWLEDEIANWRSSGIDVVVSLLTQDEEQELNLAAERRVAEIAGLQFISVPIIDRQVPRAAAEIGPALDRIDRALSAGKNVVVHCRQGVGRTGLVAACLLIARGLSPESAINQLSAARGVDVPETAEQRRWIDHYAVTSALAK